MSGRVLIALAAFTACAHPSGGVVTATCKATDYALVAGTNASELAGTYALVLVATSGDSTGRTSQGRLTLREGARTDAALVGGTDVNVEAVDALRPGPLDVVSDSAPGVLVLESGGERPRVLLRLGSGANVQGIAQFEGGYTVLQVHRISDSSFSGSWRSGTGMGGDRATGHFCADRIGAGAP